MIQLLLSLARTVTRSSKCFAALLTVVLLASSALAIGPGRGPGGNDSGGGNSSSGGGGGGQVPEFNAGAAGAALAMLTGFTLILVDRSRRERRVAAK
jgi:hypothetical protein